MDNFYRIYLENTILLVRSLVIKSEESANATNDHLVSVYGPSAVNYEDKTTWKYYLNLAGLYHPVDEKMEVLSLDTLKPIIFNKRNLQIHTKTREVYSIGTAKYKELCLKHPHQIPLIKGILAPVDINLAIEAENDTILGYQNNLVEEQEETLIYELGQFIHRFKSRWDNKALVHADEYYFSMNYAILYQTLVTKILNLRLSKAKSREAHSYHIREYLASHNKLDKFMEYLTLKQILFLYRNILYIERNSGNQHVFYWLIERILTQRFIPIHEYSQRHWRLEGDKLPTIKFRKKALNRVYNTPEKDFFDLSEILEKEFVIAENNQTYSQINYPAIEQTFKYSPSSVVQTKVLESAFIDYNDSTEFTREYIYLSNWWYLSSLGYFDFVASFKQLNGDIKTLSAKDAFILMVYLFNLSIGRKLEFIPEISAGRVVKINYPDRKETLSKVSNRMAKYKLFEKLEEDVLLPVIINSVSEAKRFLNDTYEQVQKELKIVANFSHKDERAYAQTIVNSFYTDYTLTSENISYDNWLESKGIKKIYTKEEVNTYLKELTNLFTGLYEDKYSLSKTHDALLELMKQLSSYSIQYIGYSNLEPIKEAGFVAIRHGDLDTLQNSYIKHSDTGLDVIPGIGINVNSIDDIDTDLETTIVLNTNNVIEIDNVSKFNYSLINSSAILTQLDFSSNNSVSYTFKDKDNFKVDRVIVTNLSYSILVRNDVSFTIDYPIAGSNVINSFNSVFRVELNSDNVLLSQYQSVLVINQFNVTPIVNPIELYQRNTNTVNYSINTNLSTNFLLIQ